MAIVDPNMSTTRFFLMTYNRNSSGKTVERSMLVPEPEVDAEIERLLEKGAWNIDAELDENLDETVESEMEAMLASGDFSKLNAIS